MIQVGELELYTHDEMLNNVLGEVGEPLRDAYDADVKALLMGEAIKEARLKKQLTQEQLGEKLGVKKAQVSKIEKGQNITFNTMIRLCKALGITISLGTNGVDVSLI